MQSLKFFSRGIELPPTSDARLPSPRRPVR